MNVLLVDGQPLAIKDGDTIAATVMRGGRSVFRRSQSGEPRGLFCGIGICNECLVTVDGQPNVRACIASARDGAVVATGPGGT
jgi:predicted molibdopterin-dependent oxidoreductase YjgC